MDEVKYESISLAKLPKDFQMVNKRRLQPIMRFEQKAKPRYQLGRDPKPNRAKEPAKLAGKRVPILIR